MKKIYLLHILFRPSMYIILCLLVSMPLSSQAATKYISGTIVVHVRDTTKKDYKTLAKVQTGDQVEVLEEKGYMAKIKTKNDVEGWIPSQYLKNSPPAQEIIAQLKEELAQLKKEKDINQVATSSDSNGLTGKQVSEYKNKINILESENSRLLEDNRKLLAAFQEKQGMPNENTGKEKSVLEKKLISLQNRLATLTKTPDNVVQLVKERDHLKKQVSSLRYDLTKIQEKNKKLEMNKMLHWFFAGAAVFFLGLLSSKFWGRKKSKLTF